MQHDPLLVEIRCEELPPTQVAALARHFPAQLLAALRQAGFADDDSAVARRDNAPLLLATPRRFAARLDGIAATATQALVQRRGPALAACTDADGQPSKALRGFMKSVGVSDRAELTEVKEKGQTYIAYEETRGGEALADSLATLIENVLLAINAPRLMRWGNHDFKFIRPLRGVLMLYGDTALPGTLLGVTAAPHSVGHPTLAAAPLAIPAAEQYEQTLLESGKVIVDINKRQQAIAAQFNGTSPDARLLAEVTAMCEYPTVYTGTIDEAFLDLPAFCVEECMVKHQRAFPIYDNSALTARYRFVADNRPAVADTLINGFNTVLRARLRDVEFYLNEDRKLSIDDALDKLWRVVYHHRLGSQCERVERLRQLAEILASRWSLNESQRQQLLEATRKCKSDLPTLMISEYPELEGQIAALYFCGNDAAVAELVRYHNRRDWRQSPLADDPTFHTLLLTLQLEKLVGLFGAGEKPSGNKDPHGLRHAAAVCADILTSCKPTLALGTALSDAARVFSNLRFTGKAIEPHDLALQDLAGAVPTDLPPVDLDAIAQFITERRRQELLEQGMPAAVLNAVLATPPDYLADIGDKAAALNEFLKQDAAAALIEAHKRTINILRKSGVAAHDMPVDPETKLFEYEEEHRLYDELSENLNLPTDDYPAILQATAAMRDNVDAFFTAVLVNTDNEPARNNRLALLCQLRDFFNTVGDLSQLSGGQPAPAARP